MKKNNTSIIISLIVGILLGVFVGRWSKQCPIIESRIVTTDTVIQYQKIPEYITVTKPVNKIIQHYNIKDSIIYNTDTLYKDYPVYISVDTLHYKGLSVAITDSGSCDGILSRNTIFSGDLETKIVTNTVVQNVMQPIPLFSLYGGANTTFSNKGDVRSIGPILQLSLKQKYMLGYSYLVGENSHNIMVTTKLK